jgi:hypothetical protein
LGGAGDGSAFFVSAAAAAGAAGGANVTSLAAASIAFTERSMAAFWAASSFTIGTPLEKSIVLPSWIGTSGFGLTVDSAVEVGWKQVKDQMESVHGACMMNLMQALIVEFERNPRFEMMGNVVDIESDFWRRDQRHMDAMACTQQGCCIEVQGDSSAGLQISDLSHHHDRVGRIVLQDVVDDRLND